MEHFDTKLKEFFGFLFPNFFSPTESDHESPKHLFLLEKQLLPMSQTIVQRMFFITGMEQTQCTLTLCLMCDFAAMFGLVFS
jgi:hypothetical protein